MSDDEIVFEDLTYRAPRRVCRPDFDRRWACVAYELPRPGELPIFLNLKTADAIERHALSDTSVELGGILLGTECLDDQTGQPFVWVTQSLEAKHYENTQASFTYTHDSWEEITRQRDRLHPDLDIVGWYHTHPDFGIFLSGHDEFIHRNFFAQPLQVAYVIDPIRQIRGFFQWREGALVQVGGFYLTADRGERLALARFANELENLPNPEGSGVVLSPRLEAELINMLTRPAYPPPADRTQAATLFSLVGFLAGALALAAILWLMTLSRAIHDHGAKLEGLAENVRKTSDAQRVAFDLMLSRSNLTDSPDQFTAKYAKVLHELDAARARLEDQVTTNQALAAHDTQLQRTKELLKKDLDKANKALKVDEGALEELRKLRKDYAELSADHQDLLETTEALKGIQTGSLPRKYTWAWYAAVTGWAACLVLGAVLGLSFARERREPADEPPQQIT